MTIIKKGYRITVSSYENDGDYSNTKVKDGFSEDDARFLVGMLNIVSDNLGNQCFDYDESDRYRRSIQRIENSIIKEVSKLLKVGLLSDELSPYFEYTAEDGSVRIDAITELYYEFCGGSEHYHARVADDIKVEYIPEDIEIEDVTHLFKEK